MSFVPPIRRHGISRRLGALGLVLVAGAGGPSAAAASIAVDTSTASDQASGEAGAPTSGDRSASDVAEPAPEVPVEPVSEPEARAVEPVAVVPEAPVEPAPEPVVETVAEPDSVLEASVEPAPESVVEATAESDLVLEPPVEPAPEPVVKAVAEPGPEPEPTAGSGSVEQKPAPAVSDARQSDATGKVRAASAAADVEEALREMRVERAAEQLGDPVEGRDLPMTSVARPMEGYVPVGDAGASRTQPAREAIGEAPGADRPEGISRSAPPTGQFAARARKADPAPRLCPNDATRIWPWCDDDEETNVVAPVALSELEFTTPAVEATATPEIEPPPETQDPSQPPVETPPVADDAPPEPDRDGPTADDGYDDAPPELDRDAPTADDGYPEPGGDPVATSDDGYPDALPDKPPETPMPYSPFRDFRDTLTDEVRGTDGLDPGSQALTFGDFGAVGTTGGDKKNDDGKGKERGKRKPGGGVTVKAQHQEIVHTEVDPDGSVDVTAKTRNGPVTTFDLGIPKRAGVSYSTSPQNVRETTFNLSPETTSDVKAGEDLPDWSDPQAMNPGDNISARGYAGGPTEINGAEDEGDLNLAIGGGQIASRPASGSQVSVTKKDADTASVFTGEFDRASTRTDTRIGYFGDKVAFGHSELRDVTDTTYSGTRADYDVGAEGAVDAEQTQAYGDHLRSGTPQVGQNGTYETVNGSITQRRDITENRASLTGKNDKNPAPKGTGHYRERDVFSSETFTTEHANSRITPTGAIGDDVSTPIGSSTKTTDERREGWPGWSGDAVDIEVSDWVDGGGGFGEKVDVVNEKGTYSFSDGDLNAAARDVGARAPSTLDNPVVADLAAGKSPRTAFDGADIDDINEAMTDLSTAGGTTSLHGPSSPDGATADDGYSSVPTSDRAYEPAPEPTGWDGGATADDGFTDPPDPQDDIDLNHPDVGAGDYGGDQTGGFGASTGSPGARSGGLDAFGGAGAAVSTSGTTSSTTDYSGYGGLDDFGGYGSDVGSDSSSDNTDVGEGDYGGDQTGGFGNSGTTSTTTDDSDYGGLDDFGGYGSDVGSTGSFGGSTDADSEAADAELSDFGGPGPDITSSTSSTSSSDDSSDSGGGCFLTTAACEHRGLADDCRELTALRRFRDTWMQNTPELQEQVREYYRIAPGVVSAVEARSDRAAVLDRMFERYIKPSVDAIENGENARAYEIYVAMLRDVQLLTAEASGAAVRLHA